MLKAVFPGRSGGAARFLPRAPRPRPAPVKRREAADSAIAVRLWAAALPADDTPARAYLAGRWVWPPDGIGPNLPASVRWLPRGAVGRDVGGEMVRRARNTRRGQSSTPSGYPAAQRFERSA